MYGTVIISRSIDICTIWQCNYTLLFWFFDGIHLHATHDYVQLLWHLEVLTQCSRLWISSYYSFQWLLANHIAHIINYIYHRNLTGCSPCFTSLMISASLSYQLARATWLMRVSNNTINRSGTEYRNNMKQHDSSKRRFKLPRTVAKPRLTVWFHISVWLALWPLRALRPQVKTCAPNR